MTTKFGYALSSEEHSPSDLVRNAVMAEEAGFEFALISDHFHPWVSAQGHSPFVWSVIGAIADRTTRLQLGTGVTCPTIRIHPAILAQAAATSASMMPGRFFLGLGTGENLNEHILGDKWPAYEIRAEMLEEAVEVIRLLWQGGERSHYGDYYTVENARIYTLPDQLPPIMMAAGGPKSAELAGRIADGLVATSADQEVLDAFGKAGGSGPLYGQVTICWGSSEQEARELVHRTWPNAAIKGELSQELPTPSHFEQAAEMVTQEQVAEAVTCGPDADRHLAKINEMIDAGFDHVYIHQIGPDQKGFMEFARQEILPELAGAQATARSS